LLADTAIWGDEADVDDGVAANVADDIVAVDDAVFLEPTAVVGTSAEQPFPAVVSTSLASLEREDGAGNDLFLTSTTSATLVGEVATAQAPIETVAASTPAPDASDAFFLALASTGLAGRGNRHPPPAAATTTCPTPSPPLPDQPAAAALYTAPATSGTSTPGEPATSAATAREGGATPPRRSPVRPTTTLSPVQIPQVSPRPSSSDLHAVTAHEKDRLAQLELAVSSQEGAIDTVNTELETVQGLHRTSVELRMRTAIGNELLQGSGGTISAEELKRCADTLMIDADSIAQTRSDLKQEVLRRTAAEDKVQQWAKELAAVQAEGVDLKEQLLGRQLAAEEDNATQSEQLALEQAKSEQLEANLQATGEALQQARDAAAAAAAEAAAAEAAAAGGTPAVDGGEEVAKLEQQLVEAAGKIAQWQEQAAIGVQWQTAAMQYQEQGNAAAAQVAELEERVAATDAELLGAQAELTAAGEQQATTEAAKADLIAELEATNYATDTKVQAAIAARTQTFTGLQTDAATQHQEELASAAAELDFALAAFSELDEQKTSAASTLAVQQAELAAVTEKNAELAQLLHDSDANLRAAREDSAALQSTGESAAIRFTELESQWKALHAANEGVIEPAAAVDPAELVGVMDAMQQLQAKCTVLEAAAASAQAEDAAVHQQLEARIVERDQARSAMHDAVAECSTMQLALEEQAAAMQQLQAQYVDVEMGVVDAQAEAAAVHQQLEHLTSRNTDLACQCAKYATDVEVLTEMRNALMGQMDQLQTEHDAMAVAYETVQADTGTAVVRAHAAETALLSKDQAINQLQLGNAQAQGSLAAQHDTEQTNLTLLKNYSSEIATLTAALSHARTETADKTTRSEEFSVASAALQAELSLANQARTDALAAVGRVQADLHESGVKALAADEQVVSLEAALEEIKANALLGNERAHAAETALSENMKEVAGLEEQVAELEEQLAAASEATAAKHTELAEFAAKAKAAEAAIVADSDASMSRLHTEWTKTLGQAQVDAGTAIARAELAEANLSAADASLQDALASWQDQESRLVESAVTVAESQRQLDEQNEQFKETLAADRATLAQTAQELVAARHELDAVGSHASLTATKGQTRLEETLQELQAARKDIADLDKQLEAQQTSFAALESERSVHKQEEYASLATITTLQQQLSDVNVSVEQQIEGILAAAAKTEASMQATLQQIQLALNSAQQEAAHYLRQLEEVQAQRSASTIIVDAERQALQQQTVALDEALGKARAENTEIRLQLCTQIEAASCVSDTRAQQQTHAEQALRVKLDAALRGASKSSALDAALAEEHTKVAAITARLAAADQKCTETIAAMASERLKYTTEIHELSHAVNQERTQKNALRISMAKESANPNADQSGRLNESLASKLESDIVQLHEELAAQKASTEKYIGAFEAERARFTQVSLEVEGVANELKVARNEAAEAGELLVACRGGMQGQQQQVEQYADQLDQSRLETIGAKQEIERLVVETSIATAAIAAGTETQEDAHIQIARLAEQLELAEVRLGAEKHTVHMGMEALSAEQTLHQTTSEALTEMTQNCAIFKIQAEANPALAAAEDEVGRLQQELGVAQQAFDALKATLEQERSVHMTQLTDLNAALGEARSVAHAATSSAAVSSPDVQPILDVLQQERGLRAASETKLVDVERKNREVTGLHMQSAAAIIDLQQQLQHAADENVRAVVAVEIAAAENLRMSLEEHGKHTANMATQIEEERSAHRQLVSEISGDLTASRTENAEAATQLLQAAAAVAERESQLAHATSTTASIDPAVTAAASAAATHLAEQELQLAALTVSLTEAQTTAKEWKGKHDRMLSKKASLTAQLQTATTELTSTNDAKDANRTEVAALHATVADLQTQLERAAATIANHEVKTADDATIAELRGALADVRTECANTGAELAAAVSAAAALEAQLNATTAATSDTRTTADEVEMVELARALAAVQTQFAEASGQLSASRAAIDDLRKQVDALSSVESDLKSQLATAAQESIGADHSRAMTTASITTERAAHQVRYEELNATLVQSQAELSQVRTELRTSRDAVTELQSVLTTGPAAEVMSPILAHRLTNSLQKRAETAEAELEAVRQAVIEHLHLLEEERAKHAATNAQIISERTAHAASIQTYHNQMVAAQAQVQQMSNEEPDHSSKQSQEEYAQLQGVCQTMQAELSQLKTAVADEALNHEAAGSDRDRAQKQVNELNELLVVRDDAILNLETNHSLLQSRLDEIGGQSELRANAVQDAALLQICKTQEEKIVELLQQQSESNRQAVDRKRQIADLQHQAALGSSGAGAGAGGVGDGREQGSRTHSRAMLHEQLKEAEEKVAFMYKKFIYVSARCKALEKTCRDLLDASSDANAQALSSVQTVAGGDGVPGSAPEPAMSPTSAFVSQPPPAQLQHMLTGQAYSAMQRQTAVAGVVRPAASHLYPHYQLDQQQQHAALDGQAYQQLYEQPPAATAQPVLGGQAYTSAYQQSHAARAAATSPRSASTYSPRPQTTPTNMALSSPVLVATPPAGHGSASFAARRRVASPPTTERVGMGSNRHALSSAERLRTGGTSILPRTLPPTDSFLRLLRRQKELQLADRKAQKLRNENSNA
jgi:chromosome segregation ATPase